MSDEINIDEKELLTIEPDNVTKIKQLQIEIEALKSNNKRMLELLETQYENPKIEKVSIFRKWVTYMFG